MRSPWRCLRWAVLAPVVGFLTILLADSSAWADVLTLLPVADTTLYSGEPTYNLGGLATLIAGTTFAGESNRALLRFDVASTLPHDAQIDSVTLTLTVVRTTAAGTNLFRLHRAQVNWGEGVGADSNTGSPAGPGEASWQMRFSPENSWSVPGAAAPGDYATDPSATQGIGFLGPWKFSGPGLMADVERWRSDPAGNAGWVLICAEELVVPSARRFGSREDTNLPPQLTIEYRVPDRLQVVLAPVADTSLFEYRPDNNLGGAELAAGSIGANTNRSRALIRFDISDGVPPEALVTAAELQLRVTRVSGGGAPGTGTDFRLHRVLQTWGEGTKGSEGELLGALAEPGEATWFMRFFPDVPWTQPGAAEGDDFLVAASSTQYVDSFGPYVFSGLAADVQFWREHPEQNQGWILITAAEDVPRTARRFAPREDEINGPLLRVDYLMPPRVESLRMEAGILQLGLQVLALNHYVVECSPRLTPAVWTACSPVFFPQSSGLVSVPLAPPTGPTFYRVRLAP